MSNLSNSFWTRYFWPCSTIYFLPKGVLDANVSWSTCWAFRQWIEARSLVSDAKARSSKATSALRMADLSSGVQRTVMSLSRLTTISRCAYPALRSRRMAHTFSYTQRQSSWPSSIDRRLLISRYPSLKKVETCCTSRSRELAGNNQLGWPFFARSHTTIT